MITASQVKELREKTGAGMMDCKKALEETQGDLDKAVDWLREKGIAKAAKKAGRIAAEGLTRVKVLGNKAVVYEINSETDFVAKNDQFLQLLDLTGEALLGNSVKTLEEALAAPVNGRTVGDFVTDATATIGEKITLRRFEVVEKTEDEVFGSYIHMGGKISVVVKLSAGSSAEVAKDMAMQVASMNPSFISRAHMSQEFIEHERNIQREIIKNDEALAGKPEKVREGIMEGRLSKSLQETSLVDQIYFKNQDMKVAEVLKQEKAEVFSFVRYAVGEGIEKKEDNFAEEVYNTFGN
ncbi:MAG: translation elongation factor Ts [Firmicutes bacterium GWF2_51_9]|nr:MAG: translation elongation factor Ts [Firmicutes bacterium GWF2_51_9]OGS57701.1 MAG: translation elongation factor Ts [Firmicutes bacterium GWE2_51_13]HAO62114.1 elongation factor Ts [Erysipelotrichaceae bacterium]HBZ40652.1 elongation factor Ts [Erysipelotrichaceae bacterium]